MTDYKKLNSHLVAALCNIIDIAQAAIEEAEDTIIADDVRASILHALPTKENLKEK